MTHTHLIRRSMLASVFLVLVVGTAQAGVVININQVGSDVVTTGSGTINLTDLTYSYTGANFATIQPIFSALLMGPPTSSAGDWYTSITGPTSFGPGAPQYATTGAGPLFGVYGSISELEVPQGYVSGTLLTATDTYSGQTFSSLGLTPGTYTWTWGTGADADFFTVNIGTASVPEPSSLTLLAMGSVAASAYGWSRRHRDPRRKPVA